MKVCYFTKNSAGTKKYLRYLISKYRLTDITCVYKAGSRLVDDDVLRTKDILFIEFDDYGKDTSIITQDNTENTLVVIGACEMIRPSNRCDIRFEYMYNFCKYKYKFVIDHVPFLEEKWRIFYPYGIVDPNIIGYPHSYAIETAYRNYVNGIIEEDPLELNSLYNMIKDYTAIDYELFFDFELEFIIHPTTVEQKNEYQQLKEDVFNNWKSYPSAIRRLHEYTRNILLFHNLPRNIKKIYEIRHDTCFNLTDLNVDLYLKSEFERIWSETNQLTRRLYENETVFG